MERFFVVRSLVVGALAGVVAFAVSFVAGRPLMNAAVAYEERRGEAMELLEHAAHGHGTGHSHSHSHDGAGFDRIIQTGVGAAAGMIGYGIAIALFAAVVAVIFLRVSSVHAAAGPVAAVLCAVFIAVVAVPYIRYPANPPAFGDEDSLAARTFYYFTLVILSLLALIASYYVFTILQSRMDTVNAALSCIVFYIVVATVLIVVFPSVGEIAGLPEGLAPGPLTDGDKLLFPGFNADTLYDFKLVSFLVQVALWGTTILGTVFVAHRYTARATS